MKLLNSLGTNWLKIVHVELNKIHKNQVKCSLIISSWMWVKKIRMSAIYSNEADWYLIKSSWEFFIQVKLRDFSSTSIWEIFSFRSTYIRYIKIKITWIRSSQVERDSFKSNWVLFCLVHVHVIHSCQVKKDS